MEPTQKTKAIAVGDSLYARIPAPYCKSLKIEKGTPINIRLNGKRIVYSKDETNEPRPGQPTNGEPHEGQPVPNIGNDEAVSFIGAAASATIRDFNAGQRGQPEEHPGEAGDDGGNVTVPEQQQPNGGER